MRRPASCGSSFVPGLCALLAAPLTASAAIDIHGSWLIRANGSSVTYPAGGGVIVGTVRDNDIVDVAQVGDAISFVFRGFTVSGTLSATRRLYVSGVRARYPAWSAVYLDGDVSADGQFLNLSVFAEALSNGDYSYSLAYGLGMRCGCVDGNGANGNGCDAECQVEPCWTCAGAPSVCTPAGDGSACEDADACSTGSTCASGTCTGGSPVVPCVDASGSWNVHAQKMTDDVDDAPWDVYFTRFIRQRGGHILVRESSNREYFGDIDATTGAISWTKTGVGYYEGQCNWGNPAATRQPFAGTVTPNGASFNTTGKEFEPGMARCPSSVSVSEHGTRVGCADGTPCFNGNVCVTGETCLGGICQDTPLTRVYE